MKAQTPLIKIGTTFGTGRVVGINRDGVVTQDNLTGKTKSISFQKAERLVLKK